MDQNLILEAEGLYHVYESSALDGNVVALRGLHVKVSRQAVAVVGPSGSGKSTLLKCLGRLMKPALEMLHFKADRPTDLQDLNRFLAPRYSFFIFQDANLLPDMNAWTTLPNP